MINTDPFLEYVLSVHQSFCGCPLMPSCRQAFANGEKMPSLETAYAPHNGFGDGVCTHHRSAFVRAGMISVVDIIAIQQSYTYFL